MDRTELKNLPVIPSQERLDWLAAYVDKKNDPMYSIVFGYQLLEGFLRGVVFKYGDQRIADDQRMKSLLKEFEKITNNQKPLQDLRDWIKDRHILIHKLVGYNIVNNEDELKAFINRVGESAVLLFQEINNETTKIKLKEKMT